MPRLKWRNANNRTREKIIIRCPEKIRCLIQFTAKVWNTTSQSYSKFVYTYAVVFWSWPDPDSFSAHPNIARIRRTSTIPRISFAGSRVVQIASATWSTCMGGMIRALAKESNGEPIWLDEGDAEMDPSDLRRLEGVGRPWGIFLWTAADKSKNTAAGVVRGR